jgi:hypothetical protein
MLRRKDFVGSEPATIDTRLDEGNGKASLSGSAAQLLARPSIRSPIGGGKLLRGRS